MIAFGMSQACHWCREQQPGTLIDTIIRVLLMLFLFLCQSVDLHMFDNLCVGCLRKCLKEF